MIIDNKGKLFGKISIIDLLVILIILAGISGVGYKFVKSNTAGIFTKTDTITTQFYYDEIPEYAVKDIKVGDMVTDHDTNAYFGKVTKLDTAPAVSYASDDNGIWVQSSKPGHVSVIITVEGPGIYRDGTSGQGASFNNADFFVYRSVYLRAGNFTNWGKIYSIKKKG